MVLQQTGIWQTCGHAQPTAFDGSRSFTVGAYSCARRLQFNIIKILGKEESSVIGRSSSFISGLNYIACDEVIIEEFGLL